MAVLSGSADKRAMVRGLNISDPFPTAPPQPVKGVPTHEVQLYHIYFSGCYTQRQDSEKEKLYL